MCSHNRTINKLYIYGYSYEFQNMFLYFFTYVETLLKNNRNSYYSFIMLSGLFIFLNNIKHMLDRTPSSRCHSCAYAV
jgi:hypothetical protein